MCGLLFSQQSHQIFVFKNSSTKKFHQKGFFFFFGKKKLQRSSSMKSGIKIYAGDSLDLLILEIKKLSVNKMNLFTCIQHE